MLSFDNTIPFQLCILIAPGQGSPYIKGKYKIQRDLITGQIFGNIVWFSPFDFLIDPTREKQLLQGVEWTQTAP